jgi:IclR family acetate operon transcriptional repressor
MKISQSMIEHCFDLIRFLADGRSARLSEIAKALRLAKSATHRLASTLVTLGWVEQDEQTQFYRLTLRLAILGQEFLIATGIPDICEPVVRRLARHTGELARMAVVEGTGLSWILSAQGSTAGLMLAPDTVSRAPLHVTADGKAWLATLQTELAVKHVLTDGFGPPRAFGPSAIRSVQALIRDLELTQARGWAAAMEEAAPGVASLATAIRPNGGPAVGTLSIAGPMVRITTRRIDELAKAIIEAARDLESLWRLRRTQGTPQNRPSNDRRPQSPLPSSPATEAA